MEKTIGVVRVEYHTIYIDDKDNSLCGECCRREPHVWGPGDVIYSCNVFGIMLSEADLYDSKGKRIEIDDPRYLKGRKFERCLECLDKA